MRFSCETLALLVSVGITTAGLVSTGIGQESVSVRDLAHIHGVAFSPEADGGILLATHHGLYTVDPQGRATLLSATQDDFMGFTIVPERDNLLVASGHPAAGGNLGLIASEDGGATWTTISDGVGGPVDFHALTSSPANPDVLYGLFKGIQTSRDGGNTWEFVGPAPETTIDLSGSASSEQLLFAATGSGLFRTEDGGRTWMRQGPASPVTMVETGADSSLYAFFAGAGLFAADATGWNWTVLNEDLAGREFLHMAVSESDPGHFVAVTHASEVLESRDGGKSWSPYGSP